MKKIKNKKSHELISKCVLNKNANPDLTHTQNYLSLLESSLNSILKFLLGSHFNGSHAIFKSKSSPPDTDQNTTIQASFALQQCKQTKPIFESKLRYCNDIFVVIDNCFMFVIAKDCKIINI